jgi:hypothetical protein
MAHTRHRSAEPAAPDGGAVVDEATNIVAVDTRLRLGEPQRLKDIDQYQAVEHGRTGGSDRLLVVHVTESFASGVAAAIRDFVRNCPSADHCLVYSARAEAAVTAAEYADFDQIVELPNGHLARVRFIRKLVGDLGRPALIHAHSSKAGAYVRLGIRRSGHPIVYSPHCYAFERLDVSWPVRQLFRAVEWMLSFNTTGYATCSFREAELSHWPLSRPNVVVVPNVARVDRPVTLVP